MTFDLEILNKYIEEGLVVKNDHPTLPLSIYNYSRTTQYEGKWDDITKSCRGLILDNNGNVIAKTFDKFFNLEEHKPEEIPNEEFEVYEKLDGSLGILFYYEYDLIEKEKYDKSNYEPTPKRKGEWVFATRGSFTSPQSIKGKELLKKYPLDKLNKDNTYLFEIIY